MRWAIAFGEVDPAGSATRRTGPPAFLEARTTLELARRQRDLSAWSGEPGTDGLLDGAAPVIGGHIERLTDRQRSIASMALVDGLRQADIAAPLGVSRATVSVAFARADVRCLSRLLTTVRRLWADRYRPRTQRGVTDDPLLTLAWLLLAHLVADFVLQTDPMAIAKFGTGPEAWRALAAHVASSGCRIAGRAALWPSRPGDRAGDRRDPSGDRPD